MNRFIVLAVAIALSPAAWGQLYKYVDKDGKTVYTDQPPGNVEGKALKLPPVPPPSTPAPATSPVAKEVPKPAPTAPEATAAKPEPATLTAADKDARCQAARADYANLLDGPITMRNTRTGERFQLDEKQAEAERAKAKAAMDAACKKSE